jgi:hypothetical protein
VGALNEFGNCFIEMEDFEQQSESGKTGGWQCTEIARKTFSALELDETECTGAIVMEVTPGKEWEDLEELAVQFDACIAMNAKNTEEVCFGNVTWVVAAVSGDCEFDTGEVPWCPLLSVMGRGTTRGLCFERISCLRGCDPCVGLRPPSIPVFHCLSGSVWCLGGAWTEHYFRAECDGLCVLCTSCMAAMGVSCTRVER